MPKVIYLLINMKKIIRIIIIFLLCIFIAGIIYLKKVPCIFHKLTNLYCPGCGITRMIEALINLNVYQAIRYNPLVFILLILGVIYIIVCIFKKSFIKISANKLVMLVGVIFLFWILRNIPLFSFLAPTDI